MARGRGTETLEQAAGYSGILELHEKSGASKAGLYQRFCALVF